MKKFLNIFFLILGFSIIILPSVYFLINPLFLRNIDVLYPRSIQNLENARNYYHVISSIFSVIFGLLGITLGFFYFINRKKVDAENSKRQRVKTKIDWLTNELNNFDKLVHLVFHSCFKDKSDLKSYRMEIERSFDNIVAMLEQNMKLLEFNDEEVQIILKVNSYVDQSALLMQEDFENMVVADLLAEKENYIDLIKNARRICMSKIL